MKKNKLIFTLSATAALVLGFTTACNQKEGDKPGPGPDDPVVTQVEAKHFDFGFSMPFGVRERTMTTGHDTLLECDAENVKVTSYNVPSGFTVSYEVVDASTGADCTDIVVISQDGSVKLPSVTERRDFIVTCVATNGTNTLRVSGDLHVVPSGSFARGAQELVSLSEEEQSDLLSLVESYIYRNGMAGLNFYKGSGYTKINSRVKTRRSPDGSFRSEDYIVGYGFMHDAYSYLVSPNTTETNPAYQYYWHEQSQNLPDLNYYLASGSSVSDEYSYFTGSYFDQLLDENNEPYYVPALATVAQPVPLDENGNEVENPSPNKLYKDWKITFRDDVVYHNNGTKNGSEYDGTTAKLEDFLTPYYIQYNQWMGAANVAQLMQGASMLKGADTYYYETSATKPEGGVMSMEEFDEAFEGVDMDHEENALIFHFELPTNTNFAGYFLNNYGPIPLEMIQDLGGGDAAEGLKSYGRAKESDGSTILDNTLTTGPYTITSYNQDSGYVYTKNTDYPVKEDKAGREVYTLAGRVKTVNTQLVNDTTGELAWTQYEQGFVDSASIPSTRLNDEKEKPDTIHITNTGSGYGTAIKGLSWLDYQYLFGEDGVALGSALTSNYDIGAGAHALADQWDIKDILSNRNFLLGLQTSFNRTSFAETYGYTPTADSFDDIWRLSPVAESAYNETEQHVEAIERVFGEQISLTSNAKGVEYFAQAIAEELAAGHIVLGTADNPTKITLEANWQSVSWVDRYEPIFTMISDTFASAVSTNQAWLDNGKPRIVLEFKQSYQGNGPSDYYNTYINYQMGMYDFAQTSISGGAQNCLDQINNWNCYNAGSGLTVKYGQITDIPNVGLYFKDKYWSLDAIWAASQYSEGFVLRDDGSFDTAFFGLTDTDFLDPSLYE